MAQCEIDTLTPPTATDNCSGNLIATTTTTLPITANATITWTFDDGHGNTTQQPQEAIVQDTEARKFPLIFLLTIPLTQA